MYICSTVVQLPDSSSAHQLATN